MGVAAALLAQDSVIGILRGVFGVRNSESPSLFHASEDEIDAETASFLLRPTGRPEPVLLADVFGSPLNGDPVFGSVVLDPSLIVSGSLREQFLCDDGLTSHVMEEIHDVVFASEKGEIAVDHDAIKAVIKPLQERPEEFKEELHRRFHWAEWPRVMFLSADALTNRLAC